MVSISRRRKVSNALDRAKSASGSGDKVRSKVRCSPAVNTRKRKKVSLALSLCRECKAAIIASWNVVCEPCFNKRFKD